MKRRAWGIRQRLAGIAVLVSTLTMGGAAPAFARQLEDDAWTGSVPATQPVTSGAAGSGDSWVIPVLIVAGVVAIAIALIGRKRTHRARSFAIDARA